MVLSESLVLSVSAGECDVFRDSCWGIGAITWRFLLLQRGVSPSQDLFSRLCPRLIPVSVLGFLMLT